MCEESRKQKIGVVDVGRGLRGSYAAGVLDYCLEEGIRFDTGIGVSVGSANIISSAAGQKGRNLVFFTEYIGRKECTSFHNFIHKKSYMDMNYIYATLSNSDGEYPLDYPAFCKSPMEYYAVATDAVTGEAVYFGRESFTQDHYDPLKASCAIPVVCHPYDVNGRKYYDGALSDAIPIRKAFELGCDKVVLILTLPKDTVRNSKRDTRLAKYIPKQYQASAQKLRERAEQYNEKIREALALEEEGKLLIVAPDDTCGVSTLTLDPVKVRALYEKGYEDGLRVKQFLNR